MPRQSYDIVGRVFGRLKVLERGPNQGRHSAFVCECSCGNKRLVAGTSLVKGATLSCGCLRRGPKPDQVRAALSRAATRHQRLLTIDEIFSGKRQRDPVPPVHFGERARKASRDLASALGYAAPRRVA